MTPGPYRFPNIGLIRQSNTHCLPVIIGSTKTKKHTPYHFHFFSLVIRLGFETQERNPLSVFNKNSTLKWRLTWTVYATPLMTLTTDLVLSIRVSMFEYVDWWLGPLPGSPGMGEGGDWCSWPMGVIAEGIPRGCFIHTIVLGIPTISFH